MIKRKVGYCLLLLAVIGCSSEAGKETTPPKALEAYFREMPVPDMLRFELTNEEEIVFGDTIPNGLFFGKMETQLMNGIDYFDATEDLKVIGRFRFPLSGSKEAYLTEMQQNWYRNQSLFLYDTLDKQFTQRVTVAEFYGGDGGQILGGSWLVDVDKDGRKDLVVREIEHWIDVTGEEPRDMTKESARLMIWQDSVFRESPAESDSLVKKFPIRSFW